MKNLNVFEIFKSSQFAFIKGNRPTDEKAIKAKKDSLAEYGMLCPITAVNGKAIIASGGHLTDLDGNDIADEHAKDYYAVLDGQHRLKAYLELGLPLEDLVVIEPLNKGVAIALLIAEMNICTKTWKGSDYMAAPAMAIKETNAAFDFAMELQRRNFPLSTISFWACGNNKLKAKDLVASLKTREMPQCLQEADGPGLFKAGFLCRRVRDLSGGDHGIFFLVDLQFADGNAVQDAFTGSYLHRSLSFVENLVRKSPRRVSRKGFCPQIQRSDVLGQELLNGLGSGGLIVAFHLHGHGVALLDTHAHQSHQFAQVAALAVLFQGSGAGKALGHLHEQTGRTSVDAACILNSILEFLHNHFLLTSSRFRSGRSCHSGRSRFCCGMLLLL